MYNLNRLIRLANKLESLAKEHLLEDHSMDLIDLDHYPGSDSGDIKRYEGIQRAVTSDINSTSNNYHALTEQAIQAKKSAEVNKHLHFIAKDIGFIVRQAIENETEPQALVQQISNIRTKTSNISKEFGVKLQLNELQSFRALELFVRGAVQMQNVTYIEQFDQKAPNSTEPVKPPSGSGSGSGSGSDTGISTSEEDTIPSGRRGTKSSK